MHSFVSQKITLLLMARDPWYFTSRCVLSTTASFVTALRAYDCYTLFKWINCLILINKIYFVYIPRKYCAFNRMRCVVACGKFQSAIRSGETAIATVGSFLSPSLVDILVSHCKDEELYRTVQNHLNLLTSIYTFFRTKSSRGRKRTGR